MMMIMLMVKKMMMIIIIIIIIIIILFNFKNMYIIYRNTVVINYCVNDDFPNTFLAAQM